MTPAEAKRVVADMQAQIAALHTELDRWKALAFAPMGDNHHNALACPYCNPGRLRFAATGTGDEA